ncbi:MAG: rhodanese-like domain-containing protein [Ramlibacter sp.]
MKHIAPLILALLTGAASAQVADAASAHAAAQSLARGATVVDVRSAQDFHQGHLPGAVLLDAAAALASRQALQDLVSRLGVNLSREVVVVGHPGDLLAQRLQKQLAQYATGRVTWLVGGAHEWALSGRPLQTQATAKPPVPQYLVLLQPELRVARMAGAALRDPGAGTAGDATAGARPDKLAIF